MKKTKIPRNLAPILLALLLWLFSAPSYNGVTHAVYANQPQSLYFPETSHYIAGKFLAYWQTDGGLMRFGYPISTEFQEQNAIDGHIYTVQYFERAELELHTEKQSPYDVLPSLLGTFQYEERFPNGAPNQIPNIGADSVLFPESGKHLGGMFLACWRSGGGLPAYGYPISDEFADAYSSGGKTYTVQYFERAVLELHPENIGTPYEVLLGQLGNSRYRAMYILKAPPDIAVPVPPTMSSQAVAYLRDALDYIQYNSILRDKMDWVSLRNLALNVARNAQTTSDTYPAIDSVLASLHDAHCVLIRPGELPTAEPASKRVGIMVWYQDRIVTRVEAGSLGERAGVRVGDVVAEINGSAVEGISASEFFAQLYGGSYVELTLARAQEGDLKISIAHEYVYEWSIPSGRRLEGDIGYISVPSTSPFEAYDPDGYTNFGSVGQQIIRDIDTANPNPIRGWIVDLQLDGGGSISQMVLAAGPILGDAYLGGYVDNEGHITGWVLRNGRYYWVKDNAEEQLITWIDNPYTLQRPLPPVAVLTSRFTASAGEATLISFRGRAYVRTFGQLTYGVPNAPDVKVMSDEAMIKLTVAVEMDRTGHLYGYNEKIRPDQFVSPNYDYRVLGSDDDPAVKSAVDWLHGQLDEPQARNNSISTQYEYVPLMKLEYVR